MDQVFLVRSSSVIISLSFSVRLSVYCCEQKPVVRVAITCWQMWVFVCVCVCVWKRPFRYIPTHRHTQWTAACTKQFKFTWTLQCKWHNENFRLCYRSDWQSVINSTGQLCRLWAAEDWATVAAAVSVFVAAVNCTQHSTTAQFTCQYYLTSWQLALGAESENLLLLLLNTGVNIAHALSWPNSSKLGQLLHISPEQN